MTIYTLSYRAVLDADIESMAKHYRADKYSSEVLRRTLRRPLSERSLFADGVCAAAAARVLRERSRNPDAEVYISPLIKFAAGVRP